MSPAPSSFTFEPLFLALVVVAAALYARAARAKRPPAWRITLFSLGLLLIAGALNSPLETIAANYLLLFHLLVLLPASKLVKVACLLCQPQSNQLRQIL